MDYEVSVDVPGWKREWTGYDRLKMHESIVRGFIGDGPEGRPVISLKALFIPLSWGLNSSSELERVTVVASLPESTETFSIASFSHVFFPPFSLVLPPFPSPRTISSILESDFVDFAVLEFAAKVRQFAVEFTCYKSCVGTSIRRTWRAPRGLWLDTLLMWHPRRLCCCYLKVPHLP